jgi:glutamate-1-semialdehyde 2,1-aminomutase
MTTITERFFELHPKSAALAQQGRRLFPDGVTHDIRRADPFAMYMDRGAGAHKWDVDGNEYIDYRTGHGSMILGQADPRIVAAVSGAVAKGTHLSASSEMEIKWGELVAELVPSIEKMRFHNSGTEAVMMAFRMARAYTGKDKIVRFQDAFHGWADGPYVGTDTDHGNNGIPQGTRDSIIIVEYDLDQVEETLKTNDDVAAVVFQGNVVIRPEFIEGLRDLTTRYGVLLIMDEVVSGFRWSLAGNQGRYNITPDLTTMAKILAGGLPGGAVGGRADVVDTIGKGKIAHPGTFNANPLSATAGMTALQIVRDEPILETADARAERLKAGLNKVLTRLEVPGYAYGVASVVATKLGVDQTFDPVYGGSGEASGTPYSGAVHSVLDQGMINNGIYCFVGSFILSATHSEQDVDRTIDVFETTLRQAREEGTI